MTAQPDILLLGVGYCGRQIVAEAESRGTSILGVGRSEGLFPIDSPELPDMLMGARAVVATAPPDKAGDPYLHRYRQVLAETSAHLVYLSSAGVYGDRGGAFVDEGTMLVPGRRGARAQAEAEWLQLGATSLRLPGIYGPGRSAFERMERPRIDRPGVRFCRIHVEDVADAVFAAIEAHHFGSVNISDTLPAEPRQITEYACLLSGMSLPPLLTLEEAGLSAAALGFWEERRLLATGAMRDILKIRLRYPDYKAGLTAIWRQYQTKSCKE